MPVNVIINFPSGLLFGLTGETADEFTEPAAPDVIADELRTILGSEATVLIGADEAVVVTYHFTGDNSQVEEIIEKTADCLLDNGYRPDVIKR